MPLIRERHGPVELVVINRPEAANAIDLETSEALSSAFDALAEDTGIRAVVVTAAGDRAFSAGMDLKSVGAGKAPAINAVPGGFGGLVRRHFPHPVIAAVNGAAIGGGFELVLACDLAIAAENATFGLPEVRRGLMAASGGLIRLPKCLPPALASELALTGAVIDAKRAMELGLVNRVVPTGTAPAAAMELAAGIAANAPLAVRCSKRLLQSSFENVDDAWGLNDSLAELVLSSDDAREGSAAFSERRTPRWTGR